MSGHLLSTVNPEAAARIQPPLERPPLPPIGSTVVYHMRAGFGRMGRTRFPALVTGHEPGRRLHLVVIIDAGDMMDENLVEEYGVGREAHAWEPIEDGRAAVEAMRGTLMAAHQRIGELEQQIAALQRMVVGDWNAAPKSVYDILADFETRLKAATAGAPAKSRKK